jgi:CO/xanthine dehydrogenase FAD-binding subunit
MLSNLKGYFCPRSIPEALAHLEKNSGSILVIAGGTKLVMTENHVVQELVDITSLPLSYIKEERGILRIGATTRIQQMVESPVLARYTDGLLPLAASISHPSRLVRNIATLGGELVTTTPMSPLYCALLVLQGQVRLAGSEEFALAMNIFLNRKGLAGGLLIETVVPQLEHTTFSGFAFIPGSTGLPVICAAARVSVRKGCFEKVKLAISGTPKVPQRAHEAEDFLDGSECNEGNISKAAGQAYDAFQPLSDHSASSDFRKEASRLVVKKALSQCMEKWEETF